jgi:hypothetical protein
MKVAVIGSRGFNDYDKVKQTLSTLKISLLISGGAKGADTLGERYAKENNIPTQIFLPDWNKHGKAAGFIRNTDIVENAEMIVAFWDMESRGTLDSINKGQNLEKQILIINTKL